MTVGAGLTRTRLQALAAAAFGALLLSATIAAGVAADDDIPGVALPPSPIAGSLTATENPYALDLDDVFAVPLAYNDRLDVTMTVPASADFDVYLFGPGAKSIASALQPPYPDLLRYSGRQTLGADEAFTFVRDRSSTATCFIDARAWKGQGSYTLTWRKQALPPPALVTTAPAASPYQRPASIVATVTTLGGWPLSGLSATVIANPYGSGAWSTAAAATSTASGRLTFSVMPTRQTRYRVRTVWATSSRGERIGYGYGDIITITPKAYLSVTRPTTSVTAGRAFTTGGLLKPAHAAAAGHVIVGAYRKTASGSWAYYRSWRATVTDGAWSASVALPTRGSWRLRAVVAADTLHARTYSPLRYVTVR